MKTILIASNNKGKIKEITDILSNFNIVTLKEMEERLKRSFDVSEDSETFSGNALQKVEKLTEEINEDIFFMGDDSGISIDALDGFPGVHTHRWLDGDDHSRNLALLAKMEGYPEEKRTCHYTTAIAIANKKIKKVFESTLDGTLAYEPKGTNGFGFDEIFKTTSGKTLAELTSDEKYQISPRKEALEKVKEFLILL